MCLHPLLQWGWARLITLLSEREIDDKGHHSLIRLLFDREIDDKGHHSCEDCQHNHQDTHLLTRLSLKKSYHILIKIFTVFLFRIRENYITWISHSVTLIFNVVEIYIMDKHIICFFVCFCCCFFCSCHSVFLGTCNSGSIYTNNMDCFICQCEDHVGHYVDFNRIIPWRERGQCLYNCMIPERKGIMHFHPSHDEHIIIILTIWQCQVTKIRHGSTLCLDYYNVNPLSLLGQCQDA